MPALFFCFTQGRVRVRVGMGVRVGLRVGVGVGFRMSVYSNSLSRVVGRFLVVDVSARAHGTPSLPTLRIAAAT